LPLLSAAAPYRVGYTPDSFIDIPAGPVAAAASLR
jgi:2',3'-cyclic-nucleotide 2'-phosphodiesterase/3'-nucleotidase